MRTSNQNVPPLNEYKYFWLMIPRTWTSRLGSTREGGDGLLDNFSIFDVPFDPHLNTWISISCNNPPSYNECKLRALGDGWCIMDEARDVRDGVLIDGGVERGERRARAQ